MDEIEKKRSFLSECHKVMSKNFNNSLNISSEIKKKYSQVSDLDSLWFDYINQKFRYLKFLESNPTEADERISSDLDNTGRAYLKDYISSWKERADDEKLVYLYRFSQLPPDTVHNIWYDQQALECLNWCKRRQKELEDRNKATKSGEWDAIVTEVYKGIENNPFSGYFEDHTLATIFMEATKGLIHKVNSLHQYLKDKPGNLLDVTETVHAECQEIIDNVTGCFNCFKNSSFVDDMMSGAVLEDNFITNLSLKLIQTLHNKGFDETEVINQFLREIKDHFACEVCDYMVVAADDTEIAWRAATVRDSDLSPEYQEKLKSGEELIPLIRVRESYEKGVGISGSILLLKINDVRNIWHHIGSNDVVHDPRQSEEHKSAYEEDMYPGVLRKNGEINNFWMFPIFEDERLTGAFRVVNKLNSNEELQPGGWPYFTRVQLALIAQWFSRFLEVVRPQMQAPEDSLTAMKRTRKIEELISNLGLEWVRKESLLAFIRHLGRDISKKHEKRRVGCCIFVVEIAPRAMPLPDLQDYPILDTLPGEIKEPYGKLDSYHDAVDPLQGTYVFDQNGTFIRIARLEYELEDDSIISGVEAIKKLTTEYERSVCLLLPRDTENILIYKSGKRKAEIHLSEGTGNWRFRYPEEILKAMVSADGNINEEVLGIVCDTCIQLSYKGYGAIFVIGDIPDKVLTVGEPRVNHKSGCDIKNIGPNILVEFAKLDGATFITRKGTISKTNRNVYATSDPGGAPLFPGRGTRHDTGGKISKLAPNALVAIVSENRGISLVKGGVIIGSDL